MKILTDIAYIYALIDPRTDEVRYIGKSIEPNKRLKSHIYASSYINDSSYNSHKSNWIRKLLSENLNQKSQMVLKKRF
jgi:hypothetical protein